MAYDDYSEQTGQPDDANDNGSRRRMMEFILRSALKPSLPARQGSEDASPEVQPPQPTNEELIRRAGGMNAGATSQPRIPRGSMADATNP